MPVTPSLAAWRSLGVLRVWVWGRVVCPPQLCTISEDRLQQLFQHMDADGDGKVTFGEYVSFIVRTVQSRVERRRSDSTAFGLGHPLWTERETVQAANGVKFAVACPTLLGLAIVSNTCTLQVWTETLEHCVTLDTSDCPAPLPHCIPLSGPPSVLGLQHLAPRVRGRDAPTAGHGGVPSTPAHGGAPHDHGVGAGGGPEASVSLVMSSLDVPASMQTSVLSLASSRVPGESALLSPACEYVLQAGSLEADFGTERGSASADGGPSAGGDDPGAAPSDTRVLGLLPSPRTARQPAALRALQRSLRPQRDVTSPLGFTFVEATMSARAVQAAALMVEGMHQRSTWEAEDPSRPRKWANAHRGNAAPSRTPQWTAHRRDTSPQHLVSAVRASKAGRSPRVSDVRGMAVTAVAFDAASSRLLVAYVDRVVRVWDLSAHTADSPLSLKGIIKRRAAVLNVREVAKAEKGSVCVPVCVCGHLSPPL